MKRRRRSMFSLRRFFAFFLLMSFVVTCSVLLLLNSMQLDTELLRGTAPLTLGNILLLALVFTLIDEVRRRLTVERPVKRILAAIQRLTAGDFSARIQQLHPYESTDEFDAIIDGCNQMAQELGGVETLRADFIANVSHELKTPLSVIQNYGAMLQQPDLPEVQRMEYAKAVTESACRLADLISNILKLNRLENQQIFPQAQEYDLGEQLCACMLLFEDAWEEKALDIQTDLEEGVMVKADQELLSLVWNNLFSNAFKFTPAGGRVCVHLTRAQGDAVVKITDTGCGMSPEVGAHIFEKFYQGDTSHATQGNGLGLALVKRVIDIIGGEISVESAPGKGSTFCVRLKRHEEKTS